MRLVGDLASAGHVDIYHNGHWGSVCDGRMGPGRSTSSVSSDGLFWSHRIHVWKEAVLVSGCFGAH